jgi:hypothetical protein
MHEETCPLYRFGFLIGMRFMGLTPAVSGGPPWETLEKGHKRLRGGPSAPVGGSAWSWLQRALCFPLGSTADKVPRRSHSGKVAGFCAPGRSRVNRRHHLLNPFHNCPHQPMARVHKLFGNRSVE